MERAVKEVEAAYNEILEALARVVEAEKASDGGRTSGKDAALENVKRRCEMFRSKCDRVAETLEVAKWMIGPGSVVGGATDVASAKPDGSRVPPEDLGRESSAAAGTSHSYDGKG